MTHREYRQPSLVSDKGQLHAGVRAAGDELVARTRLRPAESVRRLADGAVSVSIDEGIIAG